MSRPRFSYFERPTQGGGRTVGDYGRSGPIGHTHRHAPPPGAHDYRMPDMRKAALCAAIAWVPVVGVFWAVWTMTP